MYEHFGFSCIGYALMPSKLDPWNSDLSGYEWIYMNTLHSISQNLQKHIKMSQQDKYTMDPGLIQVYQKCIWSNPQKNQGGQNCQ